MRRLLLLLPLLLASNAPADAPADPYAQLASIDFGKPDAPQRAILDAIRAAPASAHPDIEAKLFAAVSRPDATFAAKQFAADALRIVGTKAAIPVALGWLDDPKTADLATNALAGIPGPEVDAALLGALARAQGRVRVGLIGALGSRRSEAAVDELARLARGEDAELARAALAALGRIGTTKAAAALRTAGAASALDADREQALIAAAERLMLNCNADEGAAAHEIYHDLFAHSPRAYVAVAALRGLVRQQPAYGAPVLAALNDRRLNVALRAAALAGDSNANGATRDLCAALPALPAGVKVVLLRTLGDRADKAAFPAVREQMNSADEAVRSEAVRACGVLGDESVVKPLLALAYGTGPVADAAREALGTAKLPGVDELLTGQLADDKAGAVAVSVNLLVARGDRAALPKFLDLAANADPGIRDAGLKGAEAFVGPDDVPALVKLLSKADAKDREKIVHALWAACRSINPKEQRFAHLWAALPAGDKGARIAVLPLAAGAGGSGPLATVVEQTQSSDAGVKDAALRALFAWPDDAAADATLVVLTSTDNHTHQVLAARALANRLTDKRCKLPAAKRREMLSTAAAKLQSPEDKKIIEWAMEKVPAEGK